MRELSLNILDIAQNSISAGASLITIEISEETRGHLMTLTVSDNGCGMDAEQLKNVPTRFSQRAQPERWGWEFRFSDWPRSRPAEISA